VPVGLRLPLAADPAAARAGVGLPEQTGPAVMSWLLAGIHRVDSPVADCLHREERQLAQCRVRAARPGLAAALHAGDDQAGEAMRPYSVSPLLTGDMPATTVGQPLHIEIGLVVDDLAEIIGEVVAGAEPLRLRGVQLSPCPGAEAERVSWASMSAAGSTAPPSLRFLTPVLFRSAAAGMPRLTRRVPYPGLVYRPLLGRWRRWSDAPLPADPTSAIDGGLELELPIEMRARDHLVAVARPGQREARFETGGVGVASYRYARSVTDSERRAVGALTALCGLIGAGDHTTIGMGVVRRLGG
jgi:hypothetical protein